MGQIFCKEGPEEKKDSAFSDPSSGSDGVGRSIVEDTAGKISGDKDGNYNEYPHLNHNNAMLTDSSEQALKHQHEISGGAGVGGSGTTTPSPGDQLKKLREEQARLELIVQTAGRGMVAVRSTRGSTGYYDQGFAAALAQHLEQTTQFPDTLPVRLPPPASSSNGGSSNNSTTNTTTSAKDVYSRLAQPQWEGIALGLKDGLAGCAGENPNTYMDHVAVSYLDSVVPKKERLFAGVGPMVENLL